MGHSKGQEQQIKVRGHLLAGSGLEGSWVRTVSFARQQPPFAGSMEVLVHTCCKLPNHLWGPKLISEAWRPITMSGRERAEEMSVCSF